MHQLASAFAITPGQSLEQEVFHCKHRAMHTAGNPRNSGAQRIAYMTALDPTH
jgi:hypothetical protein